MPTPPYPARGLTSQLGHHSLRLRLAVQAPPSAAGTTSVLSLRTEDGAIRNAFPADATLLDAHGLL